MSYDRWNILRSVNPLEEIYLLEWPSGRWTNFYAWGKELLDYLPNIVSSLPKFCQQFLMTNFKKKYKIAEITGICLAMIIAD
jgi:hypothetical protein